VGLEQGPLSLVTTTEQLLGRNSSDPSLELENTNSGMGNSIRNTGCATLWVWNVENGTDIGRRTAERGALSKRMKVRATE
jgi:hypothetical protein